MKQLALLLSIFMSITLSAQITPPAGMGNNMILWLSPDSGVYQSPGNPVSIGDVVSEWHDISGGGYTFTTSQGPTLVDYQGKKMLDFSGGDFLENAAIANSINGLSEFSIYIVIKSDNDDTDNGFIDSKNPNGADEILGMRYDRNGANTGRVKVLKCGMQGNTANNQIESQSNTQTTNLQVLTLTWKVGENINLYIDGVLNESSLNTVGSNMSNVQKILIGKGAKNTANNSGWDGLIGTTIFYNKKMSPDSVSIVSAGLNSINSIATGNWDDPNTWDCNCNPPNNSFANIRNNHVVSLTQNETVRNLIIDVQGSLNLSNNNYQLRVRKDFTNNGTLISNNGKIKFVGSQKQYINGAATSEFYNLHINNSEGVKITNGIANIQGALYIQNGCIETGNRVTLLSNATGTARIPELVNGTCITGDITMQRYINSGLTTWKYLSSAVSGTTIGDYSDDFFTTGFIGSNYPPSLAVPNPWVSIYTYNESIPGVIDSGFVKVTNTSNPISVGQGFWAWVDGSQTTTIDITGPPNVGNINTNLSYTNNSAPTGDGWNMVGNPYPSSIDWDAIPASDKTNINNAIYIWDGENQQYASYVFGIGANGGSKNIPSTQAFWVQANSPGPSIQFTEANKVAADAPFLKQSSSVAPLRIKTENTYGSDELVINFQTSATNNFDGEFDAKKLASSNTSLPNSSSVLNGVDYSINQINPQEISIPIKILTGITGTHIIRFENAYDFNPSSCLILEDLFSGISYNLSLVDSFSVTIYDTTQTSRFLLHIGAPTKVTSEDVSCFGNNNAKIVFSKNSSSPFNIIWRNSSNAIIANNSNVVVSDSISNLNPGEYYIETTDALCGNLIDTVFINEPLEIIAQFSTNIDTVYLSNGGIIDFTNQSTNALNYNWDFDDFNTSNLSSPTHQYNSAGSYYVTLIATQTSNCFKTSSKQIEVIDLATSINNITNLSETKIFIKDNSLFVKGNSPIRVTVRNVLGQVLFTTTENKNHSFDLSKLSSQTLLIINKDKNNNNQAKKINFIKN
ncbi:PKD domain-containing protein [Vicingaceae bacterium]|nr:PKD domain-containing protein [Vicingaceae bacterium]